jgi:hypothetical protein
MGGTDYCLFPTGFSSLRQPKKNAETQPGRFLEVWAGDANGEPQRTHEEIASGQAEYSAAKNESFGNGKPRVGLKRAGFIFHWISHGEDAGDGAGEGRLRAATGPGRRDRNRRKEDRPSRRSSVS